MITNVMITTPHDTPDLSHHGKWARATFSWPRTGGGTWLELGFGLERAKGIEPS